MQVLPPTAQSGGDDMSRRKPSVKSQRAELRALVDWLIERGDTGGLMMVIDMIDFDLAQQPWARAGLLEVFRALARHAPSQQLEGMVLRARCARRTVDLVRKTKDVAELLDCDYEDAEAFVEQLERKRAGASS